MVETKLVLPSRLEPLLDDLGDNGRVLRRDGLCDGGPFLHQVAGHVHFVPLACQVQERATPIVLPPVRLFVDVEIQLLEEVADHVHVAGGAGREGEGRVEAVAEVGPAVGEEPEDF